MGPRIAVLALILSLCSITPTLAGLKWVDFGVNGLTCSMCSRSVEMSLKRLDFVDNVVMDLETTEGRIYFKSNLPIDLNAIARAVVNAGFSVRFVRLQISFDDLTLNPDGSFNLYGQEFKWIDFPNKVNGLVALKLLDENFLPKKEGAEWRKKFTTSRSPDQKVLHVVQES
jgi:hypothetical protein